MSAVLAWVSRAAAPGPDSARALLHTMGSRGGDATDVHADGPAALGVSRADWESGPSFAASEGLERSGGVTVAADASLYHVEDLRARCGRAERARAPGALIAHAYRAWGDRLATQLEGDFAFALWDADERRLVAARDFAGFRPLFYADLGDTLLVASTPAAILAHPRCPDDLDLGHLGALAAGLGAAAEYRTAYRAIRELPAAHTLVWTAEAGVRMRAHWTPPAWIASGRNRDDAAEELRALLIDATRERMGSESVTAVTLSGGWDSSAVFGVAADLARQHATRSVVPVSVSYPEGDPGREDELIDQIATYWNADIRWIDSGALRIFDGMRERSERRSNAFFHFFESWNRALMRASVESGARVALTGYGGDQLFQTSDVYLADLLRRGRWIELAREWRARPRGSLRYGVRWAVVPNLPARVRGLIGSVRGAALLTPVERRIPDWIRPEFARRESLAQRERRSALPSGFPTRAEAESNWFLTSPFFPTIASTLGTFAAEEGCEYRSPLYDRRIVEFAATRPREERSSGPETKVLLRHAVRDLLPASILAPRERRTGTMGGYARDQMRSDLPAIARALLRRPLRLAELGIVDEKRLHEAADRVFEGGETHLGPPLVHTLETELWIRAHERRGVPGSTRTARESPTTAPPAGVGA